MGNFKTYDSEGHLLLDGYFMNGKLHGPNTGYYPNGALRHEFHFKEGGKVGTNLTYYSNAKVKLREQVSLNGIDMKAEEMDSMGHMVSEKSFRNKVPDGTWKYYGPDGKTLKSKEEYEKGILHGTRTVYYPNGEKQVVETYLYGLVTGLVKNYYEDGKLLSESHYRGNRQHGLYTGYYPNGQIKEQGEYVANKKHKEWKEFDEQGKLVNTYIFQAGILVGQK
jgi:antitoxin component YwqK of YwqJK toxin-antitoxin module